MTEVANTLDRIVETGSDHLNGPDADIVDKQEKVRLNKLAQSFYDDFGIKGTICKSDIAHLRGDPRAAQHILAVFHDRLTNSAKASLIEYRDSGKKG